jgi:hypothetical protein
MDFIVVSIHGPADAFTSGASTYDSNVEWFPMALRTTIKLRGI